MKMNPKILNLATQIAIVAVGTMLGVTALEFAKRNFLKSDFSKPLDVTKE